MELQASVLERRAPKTNLTHIEQSSQPSIRSEFCGSSVNTHLIAMSDNSADDTMQEGMPEEEEASIVAVNGEIKEVDMGKISNNHAFLELYPEPVVEDMAVMCYWRATRSRDTWCAPSEEFMDSDTHGRAEVALYAKVSFCRIEQCYGRARRANAYRDVDLSSSRNIYSIHTSEQKHEYET